ncbi:glycosyltransferase [Fibrobacter sp. UBA3629]|uniref:glycosyltransferase n=1 Tax=Fibrobacter sp. UBA3629 TaxID=1946530 RepID=UPI0025B912A9|nr:glycosyltransferase [Fibrobacter sp. UBA3629]
MKYLMVDISGKIPRYDIALCEAMASCFGEKDDLTFLAVNVDPKSIACKAKKLVSFVPQRMQNSENKFKRFAKALEGLVNYLFLAIYVFWKRPSIIHFQWLPFLEICSIERFFLRLIKLCSPKSKIWLTIHNIYPHNADDRARSRFKSRFAAVERLIDTFVLHLECSKQEFCRDFSIDGSRCKIFPHGVFKPQNANIAHHERGEKLQLVMFGNQSYYKGTDILVDAIALLPKDIQSRIHTTIVGQTSEEYQKVLRKKSTGLDIDLILKRVSDELLDEIILKSDVLAFPYREITQSGALLQALFFERPVISSNLPSFKETLAGFGEEMFFESGNAESLSNLLKRLVNPSFDFEKQRKLCEALKERYSWKNIAMMYRQGIQCV